MADFVKLHEFTTDIDLAINNKPTAFGFDFVKGEALSHKVQITVLNKGVAVSLSGATCMIYVVRSADGGTVSISADVADNVMSKELTAECFAYARPIAILATATINGKTKAVLFRSATVRDGITDAVIDPGSAIPNLAELLAAVADVEAATAAAEAATALIRYTFVKYSAITQNSDMKDTIDAWVGIYNGTSQTAPTAYTSYLWYEIKGEDGDSGADFVILGTYADLTALRAAVPSPSVGDMYNVGAAAPYNIYRATGSANPNDWEDQGTLQATTLAADMTIADSGSYFTSENVEGALQEAGASLALKSGIATIAGLTQGGVISGGVVTANGTPDQTVDVSALQYITDEGKYFSLVAVDNLAGTAADATNPRIDIVYGSGAGVITYLAGTAAGSPAQPATPAHGVLLAAITRAANDNTIAQSDITAMRSYVKPFPVVDTGASPALGGLCHNGLYRCTNASPSTAPTMTIPVIPSASSIYNSWVYFKAPNATAPVVTNKSAYTVRYQGRSVSAGTFTPVTNTLYLLSFEFYGAYVSCWVTEV
jgi:hypothetical protein